MMSIRLLSADRIPLVERVDLLNAAYADYCVPMHLTLDGLRAVDDLYDVDLARSVVACAGGESGGPGAALPAR